MEKKENEKALTLRDLEKFTEDVLMPVLDGIMNRLEKLEMDNKREHEEIRSDILDGQDTLAKLIRGKEEGEVKSAFFRQHFKEKFDKFEMKLRMKNIEERLDILQSV